jgi:hypothetical protein
MRFAGMKGSFAVRTSAWVYKAIDRKGLHAAATKAGLALTLSVAQAARRFTKKTRISAPWPQNRLDA